MALATYSDLKTAVADWLNKSNLTTRIPDFIALTEKRLNRLIRSDETTTSTLVTVAGTATVALPAGTLGVLSLILETDPATVLAQVTYASLRARHPVNGTGRPCEFAIYGSTIQLGPTPDAAYNLTLVAKSAIAPLSDANATNYWLEEVPDLLLYGALMEAEPYLANDARVALWESAFQRKLAEFQDMNRERIQSYQLIPHIDGIII